MLALGNVHLLSYARCRFCLQQVILLQTRPGYYKIIYMKQEAEKMDLSELHLTRLKPMSLRPDRPGAPVVPYKAGRPLDEVIAEMKRLSKLDLFATESGDAKI